MWYNVEKCVFGIGDNVNLHTDRLILRHFVDEDLSDLHEIFSEPAVMRYIEPVYTLEKSKEFLESFCIQKKGAVAACLKDSGKVIGYLLFNEGDEPEIREIGWIFNKNYWLQGFAHEAAFALINHGFEVMELHKISAQAIDEKSTNLMKKLGMVHEGTLRKNCKDKHTGEWVDWYIYGILAEEWGK